MRSIRWLAGLVALLVFIAPPGAQTSPNPDQDSRSGPSDVYRILVSNDDGVRASGLAAMAAALRELGEVSIVAPLENQSGKSHAISTFEPVMREDLVLEGGLKAIGLNTTPATTVNIALKNILTPQPNLVVVGINTAYNVGFETYLGGTVAGARQAAMLGVPAIAASMAAGGQPSGLIAAAAQVAIVARRVKEHGLPRYTFLNVNMPAPPPGGYRGIQVTTLAMARGGVERFAEETRPGTNRTIYWNVFDEGDTAPQGTDIWAVNNGYVSVTPLKIGETDEAALPRVREWFK